MKQTARGNLAEISWKHTLIERNIIFFFALVLWAIIQTNNAFGGPIEDLKPGEWYEVPNSNLSAVLPHPTPPGYSGPQSVITAWNGGAYDTKRDRLIVWGGGDGDYGGNEIYIFDLNTLKWSRMWGPSEAIPPVGSSCTETYSDGNPASRHTYGGLQYLPNVDAFFSHGGCLYCGGGGTSEATWVFNFAASQWSQKANLPQGDDCELGVVTGYDPRTGHVFMASPTWELTEYNPTANTWRKRGDNSIRSDGKTATIDTKRNKFVVVGSGIVYVYNLKPTGTLIRQTLMTTGDATMVNARYPGLDYDPISDRIVAWHGGKYVYTLDMDSRTWTKISPAPTNLIIPTQAPSQGTHGRWRYVPSKNVFITVNSVEENVFIYRLSPGTQPLRDTTKPGAPANVR